MALGASGVFFLLVALSEASLKSLRRDRVQWFLSQDRRGSKALDKLHSTPMGPAGALSLLKILIIASSVLSGTALALAWWGSEWGRITLVVLGVIAVLGVFHTIATALATRVGEAFSLNTAFIVRGLAYVMAPILSIEARVVRRMVTSGNGEPDSLEAAPPELNISIEAGGEPLDEREVRMIRGVVQLDQTTAREIMVPRVDIVAAELGTSLEELVAKMVKYGYSRVPVYEEALDQIKGVAYARDILGQISGNRLTSNTLTESLIRPALYIPESKTLEELLNEFQEQHLNVAIVIDEYGGVSGLVTIEDLLEEIVGEINDEFDVGGPEIEPVGKDEYLMDARVSIDQLGELLDFDVEADGFDTVGGFVYHRLGKIPSSGDTVEYDGIKIEVVSTVGRRLNRLRVTRSAAGSSEL